MAQVTSLSGVNEDEIIRDHNLRIKRSPNYRRAVLQKGRRTYSGVPAFIEKRIHAQQAWQSTFDRLRQERQQGQR